MKLHNTLTRTTDEFTPANPGFVTLYTCGPTVYNYYHIGNLRNAIFNDTLRRTLEAGTWTVRHVMNITDVGHLVSDADDGEDKLEKGALREGKTVWEVAAHYTAAFKADMEAMNVLPPNGYRSEQYGDTYARATEFIETQVSIVEQLLADGYAYQTEQAIYFDVTRLATYGELTGQKLADKETGARRDVVTDAAKHHPYDFAVWFFATGNFAGHSMKWPSPWGEGFPGWHLECSAIIHQTLGDPIDIHTGGVDHIGTHHPNEMAQTEAAFGHELARWWVHNEFMLVDGAKMSKSKGNSYTLADITAQGFHPLSYRLLCLQSHYRSEMNFSWESLQAATNTLLGLYAWADLIHQPGATPAGFTTGVRLSELPGEFLAHFQNDLSTPAALAQLSGLIETHLPTPHALTALDELLGLNLADRPDITAKEQDLVVLREQARQDKDWAAADKLRDKLRTSLLEIDDTPSGPRWRRIALTR